jgi:hypothetical protein
MATLTAKARKKIPSKEFGLPAQRKYPIQDKSHAVAAKSRATQMANKGVISKAQEAKIDKKANKVLGKKKPSAKNK